jgi:hypothetical protein
MRPVVAPDVHGLHLLARQATVKWPRPHGFVGATKMKLEGEMVEGFGTSDSGTFPLSQDSSSSARNRALFCPAHLTGGRPLLPRLTKTASPMGVVWQTQGA